MKIPLACVLLLCATASCAVNERYRKFISQHINQRMSVDRCDDVIRSRGISETDSNNCKETNTFIRSTTNHVNAICGRAGAAYGTLTKSLQPFDLVVCKLKSQGGRQPNCQYRGQSRTRIIAIRCEGGFPVHFDGDIVHLEN